MKAPVILPIPEGDFGSNRRRLPCYGVGKLPVGFGVIDDLSVSIARKNKHQRQMYKCE